VNGSIRPLINKFLLPREYIGVDIEPGKYVDVIVAAEKVVDYFGSGSFDVVIATELLEHTHNWRIVINNMKEILKPTGYLYITTRSRGFPFHAYPYDFWRYEVADMKSIFSDFEIITLKKDHEETPGVFLKAKKPNDWKPISCGEISLYSMILGRKTMTIPKVTDMPLKRGVVLWALRVGRWILQIVRAFLTPRDDLAW
jgi:SAM-dependent methyltransferase